MDGRARRGDVESEEWRKRTFKRIHQLKQHTGKQVFAGSEPLSMAKVNLLRDHVPGSPASSARHPERRLSGIDIGSVSATSWSSTSAATCCTKFICAPRDAPSKSCKRVSRTLKNQKLHRELKFPDFAHAFGFMATAAPLIEKMNHHPEWCNVYSNERWI